MEKNMIWAIVLTSIIIFGSMLLQPILSPGMFGKKQTAASATTAPVEQPAAEQPAPVNPEMEALSAAVSADDANTTEQKVVIQTKRVKATFTNKGGDLVGFELLDHIDKKTGKGIEMVDNATDINRACSMTLGDENGTLLNGFFNVEQKDPNTVLFTKNISIPNTDGTTANYIVGKRYTFQPDEYAFKLDIMFHSTDSTKGLDFNGVSYTIRTAPQIGPYYDAKLDRYEVRQFLAFNGSKEKKISIGNKTFKRYDKPYVWCGVAGKYFEELIVPKDASILGTAVYSSRIETNNYANAQAFVSRKSFTGSDVDDTYYMYYGPREEKELLRYNTADKNGWGLTTQRLNESLMSSGWLSWLETILKWIMEMLYKLIPNWGVSIIIMTVLLKLAMFPLTKQQSVGTLKMQALQPQMTALQEKYKNDPQKMQTETAKLYKESGYNPASGCLPMLLQFLVIFAMYNLFNNYFEFRGAMFIPGWIPDLSAGDSVYTFNKSIPFVGNAIRILPVIYLISQLLFGKITQNGGTAGAGGTSAAQMKFLMYGMPIIFFFLFYNAPSGLLLYWTISNIIQLGQQLIINKIMEKKKAEMGSPKAMTVAVNKKQKHGRK